MNHLASPLVLLFLLAMPVLAWAMRRGSRGRGLNFSSVARPATIRPTWKVRARWLPPGLRLFALVMLIAAAARPQQTSGDVRTSTEGIAIQLVLDRSGSMEEPIHVGGQQVRKIDVVKRVVTDFIRGDQDSLRGRAGDMVGVIAFARYSDTLSPLARAHEPIIESVNQLQTAHQVRTEDGTAIGEGLSLAAARLKRAEEEVLRAAPKDGRKAEFTIKSKVIVLLTDGQNNAGDVSPHEAAALAKQWGIRVYTIGVGAGERLVQMQGLFGDRQVPVGNAVDEGLLTAIAESTGGKYWAAEDGEALRRAYAEIDALEKSRIDTTQFTNYTEKFAVFAFAAAAALVLELLLTCTVLRRVP